MAVRQLQSAAESVNMSVCITAAVCNGMNIPVKGNHEVSWLGQSQEPQLLPLWSRECMRCCCMGQSASLIFLSKVPVVGSQERNPSAVD